VKQKIPLKEGMTIFSIALALGPRVPMKFMEEKNKIKQPKKK